MHTYEVFVDMKECEQDNYSACRVMETRYEISAEAHTAAYDTALNQAGTEFPNAIEYDIRVTRILK
ncbi:MAG: hypothetical protein AAFY78_09005 [Cyanobacteria bacterium J06648_16]